MRRRGTPSLALWVAVLAMLAALAWASPCRGASEFVAETEGYLSTHVYFRGFLFTDPELLLGLLGYTDKWPMTNGGNLRGFLFLRASDEGDSWLGPELWPHWRLSERWSLDLEAQYMWGLRNRTNDLWLLRPYVTYKLGGPHSVGLLATHTETLGDNKTQPTFLGPFYAYDLGKGQTVSLTVIKGLEGREQTEIVLDYVFNSR